jgi:hypothetical protein
MLSGAGDAMIFIPPRTEAKYAVDINFTDDSDRSTLLRLSVTANRRGTVKQVLSIGDDGAKLRVEIDPSVSDFGMGWVALRLCINESPLSDVSISFRSPVKLTAWNIAVRNIEIGRINTTSDESLVGEDALTVGDVPTAIHCVVPVWGTEYLKTYLELCLPAHLASGNLAALRGTKLIYEIYTDEIGRQFIEAHPLYRALQDSVDEILFFDIRRFRTEEHAIHLLNLNYSVMNKCHQTAIRRATSAGGALLFLNCDTVYSDGVFARLWVLCQRGYRAVENLSIRTDRDEMLAALGPRKGCLSISSSELTRIALARFHWIARNRFWEGPPELTIPDHIYWSVATDAILARATHYMPLFVFPRVRDVQYLGTIDHGFIPASGLVGTERWYMTAEDEPSSFELSLAAHDQNFNPYERGSERDLARHLSLLCENFHLHNLERPVRIAADPVPEERWREVEEASAEIVMRIRERLRKYVLTAWRPDTVTEADECALVWSPDLPFGAEPEMCPIASPGAVAAA